jgi:hypothetical protein
MNRIRFLLQAGNMFQIGLAELFLFSFGTFTVVPSGRSSVKTWPREWKSLAICGKISPQ